MSQRPFTRILTTDFETRWNTKTGYTLRKMTTEEYLRDARFKVFGCGVHVYGAGEAPQWVGEEFLPAFFSSIDWSTTAVMAHNAQFDASILSWHYGIKPAFIIDTLSMARATRGIEAGNSAAKLAQVFDLPGKGKALHSTDGLDVLTPAIERELADYCLHDVWLCEQFANRLLPHFPSKELRLIDMTIRMYTQPVLQLDGNMLVDAIHEEHDARNGLLSKLGMAEADLASNDKFAQALESLGIEPPRKTSKTTGKTAYAFAKNDAHFQQLVQHEREDVALLCEARLKVKSTQQRTRAQRFLDISRRGTLPVPLTYFGAGTGRWTAAKGSSINLQNLKRKSFLRKAIMAPIDHVLGVVDLSQIEPRVLAWLADYEELLDIFRAGGDPYASFGAQMFNIPGLTKDSHPDLRQSAKSALLGAGYGLGWQNFAQQLLTGFLGAPPVRYDKEFAKKLGVTAAYIQKFLDWDVNLEKMAAINRTCTDEELLIHCVAAKKIIEKYRDTAKPVTQFWDRMSELIEWSLYKGNVVDYKCLRFQKEQIILPSGMPMNYPALDYTIEKGVKQWHYGAKETKLYGGKVTNNVTQGTARCVMTDGLLRVNKRYFMANTVHDEGVAVVPEHEADVAQPWMLSQMTIVPSYMPGLPLAADGGVHRRYGLAKD